MRILSEHFFSVLQSNGKTLLQFNDDNADNYWYGNSGTFCMFYPNIEHKVSEVYSIKNSNMIFGLLWHLRSMLKTAKKKIQLI